MRFTEGIELITKPSSEDENHLRYVEYAVDTGLADQSQGDKQACQLNLLAEQVKFVLRFSARFRMYAADAIEIRFEFGKGQTNRGLTQCKHLVLQAASVIGKQHVLETVEGTKPAKTDEKGYYVRARGHGDHQLYVRSVSKAGYQTEPIKIVITRGVMDFRQGVQGMLVPGTFQRLESKHGASFVFEIHAQQYSPDKRTSRRSAELEADPDFKKTCKEAEARLKRTTRTRLYRVADHELLMPRSGMASLFVEYDQKDSPLIRNVHRRSGDDRDATTTLPSITRATTPIKQETLPKSPEPQSRKRKAGQQLDRDAAESHKVHVSSNVSSAPIVIDDIDDNEEDDPKTIKLQIAMSILEAKRLKQEAKTLDLELKLRKAERKLCAKT